MVKSGPRGRSSIRWATDNDIEAVHAWLLSEEARAAPGNFLCNWSVTKTSHESGDVLVYIDGPSQRPVAYQWGAFISPGILQVHSDYRGLGIGKKLVNRRLALAMKKDHCCLFIKCTPMTSISFWTKMGFALVDPKDPSNYAYRILTRNFDLPDNGQPATVRIRFYPEERMWKPATGHYVEMQPLAMKRPDGSVQFAQRVSFHEQVYKHGGDVVVEIELDGQQLCLGKAKHQLASSLGAHRCPNGFYIDGISPAP